MASEPGVRLIRIGFARRCLPTQSRAGEPLAVPLGGEVALELLHEQPTVREDQDAEGMSSLDEPGRRDRLAGRCRWRNLKRRGAPGSGPR